MAERWRAVPDCPGYEVSNLGRVRNSSGAIYGYWENKRSRWLVVVVRGRVADGRRVTKRVYEVHRLVGRVWNGLEGPIGHRDGDYRNNAAANLVACASEREAKRMSGLLRYVAGKKHPRAKLSERQVRRMRQMREKGATVTELGERFGVAHQLVSRVCSRKAWREVG